MGEHIGEGQQANDGTTAAQRRSDYVRALQEERRGYEQRGLTDRVKQVDDAIKAAGGTVKGRTAATKSES